MSEPTNKAHSGFNKPAYKSYKNSEAYLRSCRVDPNTQRQVFPLPFTPNRESAQCQK